jgi:beta-mannosidase
MRYTGLLCLLLFCACADKLISPVKTITISKEWEFSKAQTGDWKKAEVPGEIHSALLQHNLIENPYFEDNEKKLQWISETDWSYQATFTVTDSMMKFKGLDLIFEGIDTYSGIFLNDSLLLSTENMFRQYRIPARQLLRIGENTLRILLYSPVKRGVEKAEKLSYKLPGSDTGTPQVGHFIRKPAYQFGWDWSPRFVTMGIHYSVKLTMHDRIYITDLRVRTIEIADTCAWLSADVTIQSSSEHQNAVITVRDAFKPFRLRKGENTIPVTFKIFNPDLWWPRGYGKQTLYDLTAKLFINGYLVDTIATRTGIRTVELNRDEDEWGQSFYFRINGLPIFMKGANYVPQSNFLTLVKDADYRKMIRSVTDAGINMLRVWGGGVYEKEIFYNLCDEAGIMVWQDFMFANAMYPGDEVFLENVREEISYQVKRLRNHPSIAIWCGNNEIEVAWKNWGWQKQYNITPTDSAKIFSDYQNLFEVIIPSMLSNLNPARPYISTSPLSNWGKHENFTRGNMHYWGVWHGEDAIDSFRVFVPRFMSEYGMQSYPSIQSLHQNINAARITLNSPFITNRQRSYKGNGLLIRYIESRYGPVGNTESLCYLSQLNQADAMRIAIESHRREARFCMGTLYWQLNDVWNGASWSTLEKNGKWKAAHYRLHDLYAQTILIPVVENDSMKLFLQTESITGMSGQVDITVMDTRGRKVAQYNRKASAGYLVADEVFGEPLKLLLGNRKPEELILHAKFSGGENTNISTTHYFVVPKQLKLYDPQLKYSLTPGSDRINIRISANSLALGVMCEFQNTDGHFSDNYFDLLPGEEKVIEFLFKDAPPDVSTFKITSYKKEL